MLVITNLSPTRILVPLNGGGSLRLSPGTASDPLPDVELRDNPTIDKLLQQRAIAVASDSAGEDAPHRPRRKG